MALAAPKAIFTPGYLNLVVFAYGGMGGLGVGGVRHRRRHYLISARRPGKV